MVENVMTQMKISVYKYILNKAKSVDAVNSVLTTNNDAIWNFELFPTFHFEQLAAIDLRHPSVGNRNNHLKRKLKDSTSKKDGLTTPCYTMRN